MSKLVRIQTLELLTARAESWSPSQDENVHRLCHGGATCEKAFTKSVAMSPFELLMCCDAGSAKVLNLCAHLTGDGDEKVMVLAGPSKRGTRPFVAVVVNDNDALDEDTISTRQQFLSYLDFLYLFRRPL